MHCSCKETPPQDKNKVSNVESCIFIPPAAQTAAGIFLCKAYPASLTKPEACAFPVKQYYGLDFSIFNTVYPFLEVTIKRTITK